MIIFESAISAVTPDPSFSGSFGAGALACQQAGYEIASILSESENSFIKKKIVWSVLKSSNENALYNKATWIGLVERYGSDGLSWVTGEDAVYKEPLDSSYIKSPEKFEDDCFALTSSGKWKPERYVRSVWLCIP